MIQVLPIVLEETERNALQKIADIRIEEEQRVQRAISPFFSVDSATHPWVVKEVGLSRSSVTFSLNKTDEAGLAYALNASSRASRPAVVGGEWMIWFRKITCPKPITFDYPHKLRTITKIEPYTYKVFQEAGYAEMKDVARPKDWDILNGAAIKPHRVWMMPEDVGNTIRQKKAQQPSRRLLMRNQAFKLWQMRLKPDTRQYSLYSIYSLVVWIVVFAVFPIDELRRLGIWNMTRY